MSSSNNSVWNFIQEYSVLLIFGAVSALIWANIDYDSYHHIVDWVIYNFWPVMQITLDILLHVGVNKAASECSAAW